MDDLDRFIAGLPEDRQRRIRAGARAHLEALDRLTLAEIRQANGLIQVVPYAKAML